MVFNAIIKTGFIRNRGANNSAKILKTKNNMVNHVLSSKPLYYTRFTHCISIFNPCMFPHRISVASTLHVRSQGTRANTISANGTTCLFVLTTNAKTSY